MKTTLNDYVHLDGNAVIAIFLNGKHEDVDCTPMYEYPKNHLNYKEDLKFHFDWNALMDAVDEIESLSDGLYDVSINHDLVDIRNWKTGYSISSCEVGSTKIENVWIAVVQFIYWLNQSNGNN
jgi:hypothetical protein